MDVILYHNPRCSKSRATLALLASRGLAPRVIEYLKQPPDAATIEHIIAALDAPAWTLIRQQEPECAALGLSAASEPAELIAALASEPRLLQRPIVVVGDRARIGRPPEQVLDILP